MTSKNLWGDLPEEPEVKPPVYFLREQATALTKMTKGVLVGRVDARNRSGQFEFDLSIVAPALENYSLTVLSIRHGLALYPVAILFNNTTKCETEQEFLEALGQILSSPKVLGNVTSLLALSKAT